MVIKKSLNGYVLDKRALSLEEIAKTIQLEAQPIGTLPYRRQIKIAKKEAFLGSFGYLKDFSCFKFFPKLWESRNIHLSSGTLPFSVQTELGIFLASLA